MLTSYNMNLIYVALTRAKQSLYILHDSDSQSNNKHICSIMSLIPERLFHTNDDLSPQLAIIERKLAKIQRLVDEDVPYAQLNQSKDDLLLATKARIPDYFQMY
jgi:ATP-dependent exoDNAse (exonuclease V) beta subunit